MNIGIEEEGLGEERIVWEEEEEKKNRRILEGI